MKLQMTIRELFQTDALAKAFSKVIKPPMIILFEGDLGSGKTTFIKSLVKFLGSNEVVTSPTFTLLNTYQGRFPIYHFDMYRLSSYEEALAVGFEEYFDKSRLDGVCLVEWPDNVEGLINDADFVVRIEKIDDKTRKFIIEEFKK